MSLSLTFGPDWGSHGDEMTTVQMVIGFIASTFRTGSWHWVRNFARAFPESPHGPTVTTPMRAPYNVNIIAPSMIKDFPLKAFIRTL